MSTIDLDKLRAILASKGAPKSVRSGMTRSTKMQARNPERSAKARAECFGPCARLSTLLPCCVPSCRALPPSDPAHVRSRGAGGKDWANVVPLCNRHHRQSHDVGIESFQRMHNVVLEVVAGRIAELVKEHECSDWPDRTGEACGLCGKAIEGRVP